MLSSTWIYILILRINLEFRSSKVMMWNTWGKSNWSQNRSSHALHRNLSLYIKLWIFVFWLGGGQKKRKCSVSLEVLLEKSRSFQPWIQHMTSNQHGLSHRRQLKYHFAILIEFTVAFTLDQSTHTHWSVKSIALTVHHTVWRM